MGYIKEPKRVDLIIPPSKLTKREATELSFFIQQQKNKIRTKISGAKIIKKRAQ